LNAAQKPAARGAFRSELALLFGAITMALFLALGQRWLGDLSRGVWPVAMFAWLFTAMLWLSFSVVRHAESLAVKLGEPYGTLILTLSVISIEVIMISAVMLTGGENPTLARETMFAVLMIVLNGMVGLTLLVGGLRHHEQLYNLQGANAFLSVIIPFAVLGLILPRFTESTPDASPSTMLAVFLIVASVVFYGIFLTIQTTRHRAYFMQPDESSAGHDHADLVVRGVGYHAVLLVLCMFPIVLLSKSMAKVIDHGIESAGAPTALGGFLVAILVLAPEALGAVRAALANQVQRSTNICLGSALATIVLTIPAVLTIGIATGRVVELGLGNVDLILLVLSLAVSIVTFSSNRTNIVQGAVHLVLFAAYVVTIFD
jgi:Ca2+:H+ antiporter